MLETKHFKTKFKIVMSVLLGCVLTAVDGLPKPRGNLCPPRVCVDRDKK